MSQSQGKYLGGGALRGAGLRGITVIPQYRKLELPTHTPPQFGHQRCLNQHLAPSRLQRLELMHPKQRLIIALQLDCIPPARKTSGIRSAQAEKPQEAGALRSSRGMVADTAFHASSARSEQHWAYSSWPQQGFRRRGEQS